MVENFFLTANEQAAFNDRTPLSEATPQQKLKILGRATARVRLIEIERDAAKEVGEKTTNRVRMVAMWMALAPRRLLPVAAVWVLRKLGRWLLFRTVKMITIMYSTTTS